MVSYWLIGGLGCGLDSDWIPENERDCYLGVSWFKSQTTNRPKPPINIINH